MKMTIEFTIRQKWVDPRLRYEVEVDEDGDPNPEFVTLDDALGSQLWTPDLYFSTESSSFFHSIMKPNSFKRVYPDGRVRWAARVTSKVSCPMDFRYYPFDGQICSFRIESFALNKRDLIVTWDDVGKGRSAAEVSDQYRKLPMFSLKRFETGTCDKVLGGGEPIRSTKSDNEGYSCIYLDLYLQRQFSAYLMSMYLPCTMLTGLSWVSFCLGSATSARLR